MFGAPGEWTPDTREGWKNIWRRKKVYSWLSSFFTPYLSLELVIAGLRSGHDVWVKFNQNSVLSTNLTRSHVWKEFNPRRVINVTEVCTVQPHLIFSQLFETLPIPGLPKGGGDRDVIHPQQSPSCSSKFNFSTLRPTDKGLDQFRSWQGFF